MKTSLSDMTFTLPPMVVMTQVEKDMPEHGAISLSWGHSEPYCPCS